MQECQNEEDVISRGKLKHVPITLKQLFIAIFSQYAYKNSKWYQ